MLTRAIKIQMAVFIAIAIAGVAVVGVNYIDLPNMLFGVGHYTVTLELPESGSLYETSNVTYRGTEVGRVESVGLSPTGVQATLSLDSDVHIPSDLDAEVHSQTAIGEQYVALLPRNGTSPPLKSGDVIPQDRTSVPPNINSLLDATNKGLQAIPGDDVKTVIDEAYTAVGGLGPELSRFVNGATTLAIDAGKQQDDLMALIDGAAPVLESQADTSDAIQAWSAHVATVTRQLKDQDTALAGVLDKGAPVADQVRALLDRLQPTLPIILANLVSIGQVAVVYQNDLEQLLVLLPQGIANLQGTAVANLNTKHNGVFLSFNTNLNLPPTCTTGFLPAQQRRVPSFQDSPDRPAGDLYCRTPQDSEWNVRGARNTPCETVPGKRAATVKLCESKDPFIPLNEGENWKGDPNATLSGQGIPDLGAAAPPPPAAAPPGAPPPDASAPPQVPALAATEYDPATGSYIGPDGKTYTQADLAHPATTNRTWQSMVMPPTN